MLSITPSFVLWLFLLAALVYASKTTYRLYKAGETGTIGLGVSCMSGGLFLFMTVVPAVQSIALLN
jgi:hypothetical protein